MIKEKESKNLFDQGVEIGRIEGMIIYQDHLIKNLQNEREKLNLKLVKLKNDRKRRQTKENEGITQE